MAFVKLNFMTYYTLYFITDCIVLFPAIFLATHQINGALWLHPDGDSVTRRFHSNEINYRYCFAEL
jgi:hypothetical protein